MLDVRNGDDANGAGLNVFTSNGSKAQMLNLYEAERSVGESERLIPDGAYAFSSNGLMLDVKDVQTSDGAQLQLWSENGSIAQAFYVAFDETAGYYTISSLNSGKLFDADAGDVIPGAGVNLWGSVEEASHSVQQYWAVEKSEDGAYEFINAANGYALSAQNVANGGRVIVSDGEGLASSWVLSGVNNYSAWSSAGMDQFAASHEGELSEGTYIVSSGMRLHSVLDVANGSKLDRANVQLFGSNNSDAQRWRVENAGGGYIYVINVGSGKALDVDGGIATQGTNVQQYAKNGSRAQKWVAVKQDNGTFLLYSALGRSLVLDVAGGLTVDTTNIQLFSANFTSAQQFDFVSAVSGVQGQDRTVEDGIYKIAFESDEGICMDLTGASFADGATVQSYASNGTLAQAFEVKYDEINRCYSIRAAHSGKALDLRDGDLIPGAAVQQWTYSRDYPNQRWIIEQDTNGAYRIRSMVNGLYLDHGAGEAQVLTTQRLSDGDSQLWQFVDFSPTLNEGTYSIVSATAGNVVDVTDGSVAEGARVQLFAPNQTFAQKWWVRSVDENTYTFQNAGSAKYLAAAQDNAILQIADASSDAAKWRLGISFGNGLSLINVKTGTVLTASDGSLVVSAESSSFSQGWSFSSTDLVTEGFYEFSPACALDKRLDIDNGSKEAGANVQIFGSNSTLSQRFWVRSAGDGWYTITACISAMDLDVENYGTEPGTNVQQWTRSANNNAQRWHFEMGAYGIKVVSACGGNVLDVAGAGTGDGTNVAVYTDNNSAAQGWRLSVAERPAKIGYQNPSQYPQVSSLNVVLPSYCTGEFTYVSPSRIAIDASRTDCVNAFVQRAYEYIGTQYIEPYSTAPGGAVDCSGLVLQCLYATGMDMGIYNPYNHRWLPEQTYNSTNWYRNDTFMPISVNDLQRGDVVYYNGHIAIYLGNNLIIDSWPRRGVTVRDLYSPGRVIGAARPYV